MKIPAVLTNDKIEDLYKKISEETINLPTTFKKLRLGLLPRICQLLVTALKPDANKCVKFPQFDSECEGALEKLLEDPQSLTALLMSDQVFQKDDDVEGRRTPRELKSKINQEIQIRLNRKVYKEGHRVQLFAVDHSMKEYAYPSCFYSPEGTPTLKQSEFYARLLKRFLDLTPSELALSDECLSDLGEVLFEIVENTEQHSKAKFIVGEVRKSVRGVVVDYKLITKSQSSESIGGKDTPVTQYLNGIREGGGTLKLLEISVFDSGEGIFQSLQGEGAGGCDLREEVNVVQKSFAKGVTSKANSKGYGRGLFNVRDVLQKRKGFLSVRTGRLSLYRDFNLNPLSEFELQPLKLLDEKSHSDTAYTQLLPAEGLAYSILVPLQ